jgi:hypothetical protein
VKLLDTQLGVRCETAATSFLACVDPDKRIASALSGTCAGCQPFRLRFCVSADEEEVELFVANSGEWRSLGSRNCFYLALILARRRLAEHASGADHGGWITIEQVLKMIPEYQTAEHVTVDIHRIRQAVASAGVHRSAELIERRRGAIRLADCELSVGP